MGQCRIASHVALAKRARSAGISCWRIGYAFACASVAEPLWPGTARSPNRCATVTQAVRHDLGVAPRRVLARTHSNLLALRVAHHTTRSGSGVDGLELLDRVYALDASPAASGWAGRPPQLHVAANPPSHARGDEGRRDGAPCVNLGCLARPSWRTSLAGPSTARRARSVRATAKCAS